MLTVSCVLVGNKYKPDYVIKLRGMVRRHLEEPHRFVCLTDKPDQFADIETVDVSYLSLPGWWAKLALFSPRIRGLGRCLYFDLDTVICGDLEPLASYRSEFAICENFARLAGYTNWPCRYGSCVMSFPHGWGEDVWRAFERERHRFMIQYESFGDQRAIEELVPEATLLQSVVPPGYFLGYRALSTKKPDPASVVIFAGKNKPHSCNLKWIKEAWAA